MLAGIVAALAEYDRELIHERAAADRRTGHVHARGIQRLPSTIAAVRRLSHYDVGDHLDVPLADFLALPEVTALFQEIQPGGHAPSAPILAVQSVHDQLIAVDDVDGQIARYRAAGAHVTYRRDRLSEHIALHPLAAPLT